jgi:hypothetical protein
VSESLGFSSRIAHKKTEIAHQKQKSPTKTEIAHETEIAHQNRNSPHGSAGPAAESESPNRIPHSSRIRIPSSLCGFRTHKIDDSIVQGIGAGGDEALLDAIARIDLAAVVRKKIRAAVWMMTTMEKMIVMMMMMMMMEIAILHKIGAV